MDSTDRVGQEAARLRALPSVPHILDIICRTTGMRFAAIARVTEDRWITCTSMDRLGFGLGPGDELPIDSTFCQTVRDSRIPIVFDDAVADHTYRDHPVTRMYGIRSYVSVPIVLGDGTFFGTLCALDVEPRRVSEPRIQALFESFAELIARELDSRDALRRSRRMLREEREAARLREEIIAVLGHDLRSPLASVISGLRLIRAEPMSARATEITDLMQTSLDRMDALVDNLLDLARTRLGGGIPVQIVRSDSLAADLAHIVDETRTATGREIRAEIDIDEPVDCDPQRIGQLLSNLLGNAVTHGAPDMPIVVEARRSKDTVRLSVTNGGDPIPPEMRESLFRPFVRAGAHGENQGLGLGLYIANEIARAHGGGLALQSDARETRFTLTLPARSEKPGRPPAREARPDGLVA